MNPRRCWIAFGFIGSEMFRSNAENDIPVHIFGNFPFNWQRNAKGIVCKKDSFLVFFEVAVEKVCWRSANESGYEKIGRIVVNLKRGINLLNYPVFHHADAIAHGHGFGLIMRDINHGGVQTGMNLLISERIWTLIFASRLESGSSKRKTFGLRTMVRPSATRCRCPRKALWVFDPNSLEFQEVPLLTVPVCQ